MQASARTGPRVASVSMYLGKRTKYEMLVPDDRIDGAAWPYVGADCAGPAVACCVMLGGREAGEEVTSS